MVIHIKINRCAYCNQDKKTNNKYCSHWCWQKSYARYRTEKARANSLNLSILKFKRKLRYCKCGVLLKKYYRSCDDCRSIKMFKNKKYGK